MPDATLWLYSQQIRFFRFYYSHREMYSFERCAPSFCSSSWRACGEDSGCCWRRMVSSCLAFLVRFMISVCSGVKIRVYFRYCWYIFHAVLSLRRSRCFTQPICRPIESSFSAYWQILTFLSASRSCGLVAELLRGVSSSRSRQQVSESLFFFLAKQGLALSRLFCCLPLPRTSSTSGASSCSMKSSGMMESRVILLAGRTTCTAGPTPAGTVTQILAKASILKALGCLWFLRRQRQKNSSVGNILLMLFGTSVSLSQQNQSSLLEARRKLTAWGCSYTQRQKPQALRVNCLQVYMNHFFLQI